MRPFCHTAEMVKHYTRLGFWGNPVYCEVWDQNALSYGEREDLVDSRGRGVTWETAKKMSDRLALGLLELGFKRDDIIVIQLPNICEHLIIRVACQKAGILCLPVGMGFREAELKHIFELTNAKGIVIISQYHERDHFKMVREAKSKSLTHVFLINNGSLEMQALSIEGMQVWSIEGMIKNPLEEEYPADFLKESRVGRYDVMALTATSGTTGLPKVSEEYNYPHQFPLTNAERWRCTQEDVIGLLCPLSGGVSVPAWITFPFVPCKLALLESWDVEAALKFIKEKGVSIAVGVPAQLIMLMDFPELKKDDLTSLRAYFSAGAPLSPDVARRAEEKLGCRIVGNLGSMDFGPIAIKSIDDPPEIRFFSVGKSYPGNELRLVDEKGTDVSPGEAGELLVRGPYAMTGILNDHEETLKTRGGEKDGWFITGDLARVDEQGNIFIVGRKKETIIRGGQNITPAEVENLLLEHTKVKMAAITPVPDEVLGEKACACIIPKTGEIITFDEMIAFLKEKKLAPYKFPEYLEVFASFPMSGDGQKILKREMVEIVKKRLGKEK